MALPNHMFVSDCDGALHDTRVPNWAATPIRVNYARHHRTVETVADLKACLRAGDYAWPGGYQLAYITADGGLLHPDTVRAELSQIVDAIWTNDRSSGWRIVGMTGEHEMDFPAYCYHTGRKIWSDPGLD